MSPHTGQEPMRERTFGRTGWSVGEVGYGMWGMGAWSGSDDEESIASLEHAVDLGCDFFDTATKVPPKNMKWPAAADASLEDSYPPDHIREFTEKSLANIGVSTVDL